MGYLAATGAYLILALAIGFIIMVVGLFVGHIMSLTASPSASYPVYAATTFSPSTRRSAC